MSTPPPSDPPPGAPSPDRAANRLAGETSPYLLQHAHNPVDWYPWGPEALARARAEDKPIFLSIGYAACHWCHVMERESFEDEATAAELNRDFVPIKVDREERPDLDQVYMAAVQAMTGQGGWPMSVFLTPGRQAVLRRHVLPRIVRITGFRRSARSWPASPRRTASSERRSNGPGTRSWRPSRGHPGSRRRQRHRRRYRSRRCSRRRSPSSR